MAKVIDTLIVEMKLQADNYKKSAKQVEQSLEKFAKLQTKTAEESSQFGKSAAAGFRSVRNELLTLGAALMGVKGVKDFFTSTIQGQTELGRTSQFMNMNARELDAWGKVMESAGLKADDFISSTRNIQKNMRDARIGQGGFNTMGWLSVNKIAYEDVNGKIREQRELWGDIADVFQKFPSMDESIKQAESLGISENMIPVLRKGRQALYEVYDAQYKNSGVTDQSLKAAQESEKAWKDLSIAFNDAGQKLFASKGVIDGLNQVNSQLKKFSDWISSNDFNQKLDATVKTAEFTLRPLTLIFEGWKNIIDWVSHGVEKVTSLVTGKKTESSGGNIFNRAWKGLNEYMDFKSKPQTQTESAPIAAPQIKNTTPTQQENKTGSRGFRNNNPGNLRYSEWTKNAGAIGADKGGFAIFADMKTGADAQLKLLNNYANKGINTIRSIISKYAPPNENDTQSYINDVAKKVGVSPDVMLTASQRQQVQKAQWGKELGKGEAAKVEAMINNMNVYTTASTMDGIKLAGADAVRNNELVTRATGGGY